MWFGFLLFYQVHSDIIIFIEFEIVNDNATVPTTCENVMAKRAAIDKFFAKLQFDVRNRPFA